MGYIIVVFLAAVLAFQCVNAEAVQSKKNVVDDLLKNIENKISNLTTKLRDVVDKSAAAVQSAAADLNKLLGPLTDEIFTLMKQATDVGEDATKCTTDKLPELTKIPTEAATSINQCIQLNVNSIINEATGKVKDFDDELASTRNDLRKCDLLEPQCIFEVLQKATKLLGEVTQAIFNLEASKYAQQITNCGVDGTKDATLEINKEADDIIKCIKGVITGDGELLS